MKADELLEIATGLVEIHFITSVEIKKSSYSKEYEVKTKVFALGEGRNDSISVSGASLSDALSMLLKEAKGRMKGQLRSTRSNIKRLKDSEAILEKAISKIDDADICDEEAERQE